MNAKSMIDSLSDAFFTKEEAEELCDIIDSFFNRFRTGLFAVSQQLQNSYCVLVRNSAGESALVERKMVRVYKNGSAMSERHEFSTTEQLLSILADNLQ